MSLEGRPPPASEVPLTLVQRTPLGWVRAQRPSSEAGTGLRSGEVTSHTLTGALCAEACPRPRASPKSEIIKNPEGYVCIYYGKSSPRPARAGHS